MDLHLNSPLIHDEFSAIRLTEEPCHTHKEIHPLFKKYPRYATEAGHPVWQCLNQILTPGVSGCENLLACIHAGIQATKIAVEHWTGKTIPEDLDLIIMSLREDLDFVLLTRRLNEVGAIKDYIKNKHKLGNSILTGGLIPTTILVHKDVVFFSCIHGYFHCSYNLLVGELDTVHHQWNQHLLASILDVICPSEMDRVQDFVEFRNSVMQLYSRHTEDLFDILKLYEPLCIGRILLWDPLIESRKLWEETLKEVLLIDRTFEQSYLYTRLYTQITKTDLIYHLIGSLGWVKCFGHPHVIPELGIKQLLKNTSSSKYYVLMKSYDVASKFKETFLAGYYLKHNTWPPVEDKSTIPYALRNYYETNTWPTSPENRRIPLIIWGEFPLKNILKFSTEFSPVELLSDKSLAPTRGNWHQSFDKCSFTTSGLKKPYYVRETIRVLEDYIKGPGDEINRTVDYIEKYNDLPHDMKHVVLCWKECELNKKRQTFCQAHYHDACLPHSDRENYKRPDNAIHPLSINEYEGPGT